MSYIISKIGKLSCILFTVICLGLVCTQSSFAKEDLFVDSVYGSSDAYKDCGLYIITFTGYLVNRVPIAFSSLDSDGERYFFNYLDSGSLYEVQVWPPAGKNCFYASSGMNNLPVGSGDDLCTIY